MKRQIIFCVFIFTLLSVYSKTTYIPHYRALIQIHSNVNDTISTQSNCGIVELMAEDSTFCISVVHEDVSKEKVKSIKRMKAAAGWMLVGAMLQGASAQLTPDRLSFYLGMENSQKAAILSGFLRLGAKGEQTLNIEIWVDNFGDKELMVADMERGLIWFVQPHSTLQLNMPNPNIENLRVSDLSHQNVKYVTAIAGSIVVKENIEWEDEECWIVARHEKVKSDEDFYEADKGEYNAPFYYYYINKETFEWREMTDKEIKDYKKQRKS